MRIILASGSPRRQQLLEQIIDKFEIISPLCDEQCEAVSPQEYVMQLAERKAMSVLSSNSDSIVIGCDTVVAFNGEILLKPRDNTHAKQMLNMLSNNSHNVYSGVCVVSADKKQVFCESTAVNFRKLSQQEIDRYVATGSPLDKAGAYGIQDSDFVSSIDGDYDNVMGFPIRKIRQVLASEFGVITKENFEV